MIGHTIVFDLDGTIVDSARGIAAALASLNIKSEPICIHQVRACVALGAEDLISKVLNLDSRDVERFLLMFRGRYAQAPCQPSDLFPGALEALKACRRRGLKVGVCTNKPQQLAEIVVDKLEISELVDAVIGASSRFPQKPSPAMLNCLLESFQSKSAVFVGDTIVDAETAHRARVPFIFASFGYGSLRPEDRCLASISHFDELAPAVDKYILGLT